MARMRASSGGGVRHDPRGHRDEVHDGGGDHEQVEELVEAEGASATGPGGGRRRSSRRPSRGRRRRGRARTARRRPRSAAAARRRRPPSPPRGTCRATSSRGASIHASANAIPSAAPVQTLARTTIWIVPDEHEQGDRGRAGRDEQVDRRVVDAAQQRLPARMPAPAVVEAAGGEQRAQRRRRRWRPRRARGRSARAPRAWPRRPPRTRTRRRAGRRAGAGSTSSSCGRDVHAWAQEASYPYLPSATRGSIACAALDGRPPRRPVVPSSSSAAPAPRRCSARSAASEVDLSKPGAADRADAAAARVTAPARGARRSRRSSPAPARRRAASTASTGSRPAAPAGTSSRPAATTGTAARSAARPRSAPTSTRR